MVKLHESAVHTFYSFYSVIFCFKIGILLVLVFVSGFCFAVIIPLFLA